MKREDFGLTAEEPKAPGGAPALKLTEMPSDERPRERAMIHGMNTLLDHELLAVVLRTGLPGMPITHLCRQLMKDSEDSLLRLLKKPRKELMLTKGIGSSKALQIEALAEIWKRANAELNRENGKPVFKSSRDIYNAICYEIANLGHEEIHVILINRRNQEICRFRVTSGSQTASVFDSHIILKRALLEEADGMIMCHNHPSGNLLPSSQDDSITHLLFEACRTIQIRMLDHIIVTTRGYYSYRDEGRLR